LTLARGSGKTVAMPVTAEQLRIAEAIELRMRQLLGAGWR